MRNYSAIFLMALLSSTALSQNLDNTDLVKKDQPEFAVYPLKNENISASSYESKAHGGFGDYYPYLVIDGNIANNSSWRAEGNGQWIQVDLNGNVPVDHILVCFMKGEVRSYQYTVETLKDNTKKWKMIIPLVQSKKIQGFQKIDFPANHKCRYIRITGYGNSDPEFKNWFNINEVQIMYRVSRD